jgi:hypothetical protein
MPTPPHLPPILVISTEPLHNQRNSKLATIQPV